MRRSEHIDFGVMRAKIFHTGFWALAGTLAILCSPLLLWPGPRPATFAIDAFAKLFRRWLQLCGVRVEYRGLEHIPKDQF